MGKFCEDVNIKTKQAEKRRREREYYSKRVSNSSIERDALLRGGEEEIELVKRWRLTKKRQAESYREVLAN